MVSVTVGRPAWDGAVHVFDLIATPKRQRPMAGHRQSRAATSCRFYAMLGKAPINSAANAVRAAIAAEHKKGDFAKMPRREGPLDRFAKFSRDDPVARLFVHYFFPADFMYRDYRRVTRALDRQQRRTKWRASQQICYLRLWLAALYRVIEGYRALKLKDDEIDTLLINPALDSLRLFRNGTLHYQKQPDKLLQFFSDTHDGVEWAERLHAAFDRFESDYRVEVTARNVMAAKNQQGSN